MLANLLFIAKKCKANIEKFRKYIYLYESYTTDTFFQTY